MRDTILTLLVFIIFSCTTNDSARIIYPDKPKQQKVDTVTIFVDSTNIAFPNGNKVWLAYMVLDDSIPKAILHFYSKENNLWKLIYSFEDEHWSGEILMPEIVDFNNDGYKDFKYLKGTGARGGNGINNLFIYDKSGDNLFYVVNSEEYPNLYYNHETNTINSYILTGCNETEFMRLDGSRLTCLASVDQCGKNVIVYVYDKKGVPKIISEDISGKYEEFANFINYDPLKVE